MFTPLLLSRLKHYLGIVSIASVLAWGAIAISFDRQNAQAQAPQASNTLTVRSDIQEANSETGVITARGNVQINYPSRNLQATSAQAQYFRNERRLVLTGNVYVLQNGNSMRAESMTYLIDEGRFVATPKKDRQVESIYLVNESPQPTTAPTLPPTTPSPTK